MSIAVPVASRSAAPAPWSSRARIKSCTDGAAPQSTEARVNSPSPVIQIGVRPTMSDSRPTVSSNAAATTR